LSWLAGQQVVRSWSLDKFKFFNEVLDNENIGEFSLDDDSIFGGDYMQLVTPGTHGISDSECDNGGVEQREENVNV
jgi:hypothetical protein